MTASSGLRPSGNQPPRPLSPAVQRRLSEQRVRDTTLELSVRRLLHARGFRYRVDAVVSERPRRRADIVFTRLKLAIFLDGCFWHQCPEHSMPPKNNSSWWAEKLRRNVARDLQTVELLETRGWRVLRFWEHESQSTIVDSIASVVAEIRTAQCKET